MAYRQDRATGDIIIDGWEQGIADDPYVGIADMRNVNLSSVPREASVNFSMAAVTLPPVLNTVAFTATAATDVITISSTTGFYNGMAIIINTITSGAAGLSATAGQNVYYVKDITATTFKVSKDLLTSGTIDITTDGSGTLSTAQLANPYDWVQGADTASGVTTSGGQVLLDNFILDSTGQLWLIGNGSDGIGLNVLQFCGNTNRTTLSTTGSLGIAINWGYVFCFIQNKIDYIKLADLFGSSGPYGNWHIGWQSTTAIFSGHKAIAATDDAVYFCNAHTVGSILENAGSTFDPATSSTYTYNASALTLPSYEYATCLAQLGVNLLIGGVGTYVYPWDRVSTSFSYPLIVAEKYTKRIVSTNSTAYIFPGRRGRIYMTNGANIQLFKKFPDQLSGTVNPYYSWGDALYFRNQLYFSISATDNNGTTISNFGGVWSISLDAGNTLSTTIYGSSAGPLRLENSLSYAAYTGTVPVIMPMGNINPQGNGIYAGWVNNSAGGIDYSQFTPYSGGESYIDTDIIPVGTYYNPETNQQIEYKLSKPMVSGESIKIAWRGNLTDSFTNIPWTNSGGATSSTQTTAVSEATQVNFQKQQWVQFRITLTSTATTPSYVRLREIRLR